MEIIHSPWKQIGWLFFHNGSLSHLQKLLLVLGAVLKLECFKMLPEMKIKI